MKKSITAGGLTHLGWGLKSMTEDDILKIHDSSLEVLGRTGIEIDCDEALDICQKGGCKVNKKTKVVRFPSHLVEEMISKCPKKVLFAGRDPEKDFVAGRREIGFTNFGTGLFTEELDGKTVRGSTVQDLKDIVRLCDALDTVDFIVTPVAPKEIPKETFDLHVLEACMTNSSKHYGADCESGEMAEKMIEMAKVVAGGSKELQERPILSFGICPISPLRIPKEAADVIIVSAKHGIPIEILSMALAGATSPMSLSGTMVTHNAEVLAGMVLAQLVNPGVPTIYGSSTAALHMRYGSATIGTPEFAMLNAALAEMAHYYEVPVCVGGL